MKLYWLIWLLGFIDMMFGSYMKGNPSPLWIFGFALMIGAFLGRISGVGEKL